MAFKVNWTRRALGQLEDAAEYIEKDSPKAAAALIARAFEATDRLVISPVWGDACLSRISMNTGT